MASTTSSLRRFRPLLFPSLALVAGACGDPPQFLPPGQLGAPAGVLEGTVAYSGPLPCTENQHIVGAAVLEIFDVRALPPPEGLGTTAASIAVVPGETLFAGVRDRLTFKDDNSRWCPDPSTAPVLVSAPWSVGPLDGGVYEVRGFYDLDGNFNPILSVFKFPTKGDIAGGAIENTTDALAGKPPIYRKIALGAQQADGSYKIPDEGSRIGGVTVSLGLPLPLDPPIFNAHEVFYSSQTCDNGVVKPAPMMMADPSKPIMPSDYTLPVFSPDVSMATVTEDSLIRIGLQTGVAFAEKDAASVSPFNFPVNPAAPFTFTWQDVNGDGMLDLAHDHVPDSDAVPSLFPLAIFNKLVDPDPSADKVTQDQALLTAQSAPVVILQGLTMYKDLPSTGLWGLAPPPSGAQTYPSVVVGVRPAVLCLDPQDATKHAKLVVTHRKDCGDQHDVISNEDATKAALKAQFGRTVDVVEACLPEGKYAMNLVYSTGQAWTVPNEAGVCQPLEASQDDGKSCGDPNTTAHRPILPSQSVVLTIGPPKDAAYCKSHPLPAECMPVASMQ
jgi:hypothetical protein